MNIEIKKKKGAPPHCGPNHQILISSVIQSILNDNFEICGCCTFYPCCGKYALFKCGQGPSILGKKSRYCETFFNNHIVWHTHPSASKIYPSWVDLIKVVKHSSSISIIFCKYGFWTISCNEKILQTNILKFLEYYFKKCGDNFYHNTNGGYTLNLNALIEYIKEIDNIVKRAKFIPSFKIKFNYWKNKINNNDLRQLDIINKNFCPIKPDNYFF